jgi:hypothetical protein
MAHNWELCRELRPCKLLILGADHVLDLWADFNRWGLTVTLEPERALWEKWRRRTPRADIRQFAPHEAPQDVRDTRWDLVFVTRPSFSTDTLKHLFEEDTEVFVFGEQLLQLDHTDNLVPVL